MTAQASNTVVHRDADFKLAHYTGSGLLNVFAALGYQPRWTCTACYAGYIAGYSIIDGGLFLSSLTVAPPDESHDPNHVEGLPKLFGVSAARIGLLGAHYEGLREPMPFTGGLILGDALIWDLIGHSGSHPAWKYERVYEITFDSGQVIEEHDRSASMADYRTKSEHYWKRKGSREIPLISTSLPTWPPIVFRSITD